MCDQIKAAPSPNQPSYGQSALTIKPASRQGYIVTRPGPGFAPPGESRIEHEVLYAGPLVQACEFIERFYEPEPDTAQLVAQAFQQ